ncbi:hypothetical protein [Bacillus altitudinis]|nr:hypothetical protein [Bacillus altitudinis]
MTKGIEYMLRDLKIREKEVECNWGGVGGVIDEEGKDGSEICGKDEVWR